MNINDQELKEINYYGYIYISRKEWRKIKYKYFPEGHEDKNPGTIIIYLENSLIDSLNRLRVENGMQELTEEEWPRPMKDETWYYYADHAISRIVSDYKKGKILEKGTVVWY